MRFLKPIHVFVLGAILMMVGGLLVLSQSSTEVPAYLKPNQPADRRVEDLLARMTLKEKTWRRRHK